MATITLLLLSMAAYQQGVGLGRLLKNSLQACFIKNMAIPSTPMSVQPFILLAAVLDIMTASARVYPPSERTPWYYSCVVSGQLKTQSKYTRFLVRIYHEQRNRVQHYVHILLSPFLDLIPTAREKEGIFY